MFSPNLNWKGREGIPTSHFHFNVQNCFRCRLTIVFNSSVNKFSLEGFVVLFQFDKDTSNLMLFCNNFNHKVLTGHGPRRGRNINIHLNSQGF